jgi:hypothetical protein
MLRFSAIVNKGKEAETLTEMTSTKSKIVICVNIAVSTAVKQILDKAECENCSRLLSLVL